MNKKIIVFICILSLLVPFLPSFDYNLYAYPYVPSESENSWIEDLEIKFQTYLGNNGVVANSDWFNRDYVGGFWNDLMDYFGFEQIQDKDFASTVYDYSIQNNQSADMIFNDSSQFILNSVNSELSYFVYETLYRSDLPRLFTPFSGNTQGQALLNDLNNFSSISLPDDYVYFCSTLTNIDYSFGSTNKTFTMIQFDKSLFDDFVYLTNYDSSKSSLFENEHFFNNLGRTGSSNYNGWGTNFFIVDFDNVQNTISANTTTYNINNHVLVFNNSQNFSSFPYFPLYYYEMAYYYAPRFVGGFFIIPDSMEKFSFPVFKSYNDAYAFKMGDSEFYKFDSSIDLGQYADDIDYSRLYDIISREISHSSGNIIGSINSLADSYLQQQLDVLHDINNALNDGNGQSWLRLIYGLLDYNFPLTLHAFDDLKHAIENISISVGGSDLSHINRVLDEINEKLGFMIEEPLTDADVQDLEDLKNFASQKFPFCVFSDIVAISVVLNQTPEQPHWQIPLKLPGSESVNNIEVDLSWYEEVRPVVQGVFIFIFIVGLLALSVKVFNALKS